jgi:hypothetical protein
MPKITVISPLGSSIQTGEIDNGAVSFVKLHEDATIHRKQFSDATDRTSASTTLVDSGTAFALSAPVNSVILGGKIKFDIKIAGGGAQAAMSLEIEGTNLGSKFLILQDFNNAADAQTMIADTEATTMSTNATTLQTMELSFPYLEVLDATTNIVFRIKTNNGGQVVTLDNVAVDIMYIKNFTED